MALRQIDTEQYVTASMMDARFDLYTRRLQNGEIQIPVPTPATQNFAGGTNDFPNGDISFSLAAVTVQGTLPATAGDNNQEAYQLYRQKQADNITIDATPSAHALKAVGHSLYAA